MDPEAAGPVAAKIRQDPFAKWLGIEFEDIRPGYARASLRVTPDMLNFHGVMQGGAIFTLADAAFGAASNSHGQVALALTVTIQFLAPASAGARLLAEAEEVRLGRRAGFYRLTVTTEDGGPIAVCQAVAHRRSTPLVPA
jgi:acyl-CoA thioesterase